MRGALSTNSLANPVGNRTARIDGKRAPSRLVRDTMSSGTRPKLDNRTSKQAHKIIEEVVNENVIGHAYYGEIYQTLF
jgi:hypothetical protein